MLYLATPSSHSDPAVMRKRYQTSCRAAAKLLQSGIVVFNPLANGISAVELGGLELEYQGFITIDLEFLRRSDEVLVLGLAGWKESDGVIKEIFESFALRKPVTLIAESDIDNLPVIPNTAKTYLSSNIFHAQ
jgi:hypothetical protein